MNLSELWSYDFMRYALASALLLGPACALLGVFVTLRGLAFFSDALAHSAFTGVALAFLIQERTGWSVDPMVTVFVFSLLLAGGMAWLMQRTALGADSVIAVSFTGSVAAGAILITMLGRYRIIDGLLFGSIYANGSEELARQAALVVIIGGVILSQMRRLTLATLSPELAQAQGIPTAWGNVVLVLLIAATVVVSLKMLGALLLSALIVIPASAARMACGSFRAMLGLALLGGVFAPASGVVASAGFDLPTGPCIVLANILFLVLCGLWKLGRAEPRRERI
jgi:zinc transport system permease protein